MNRQFVVLATLNNLARDPFEWGSMDCCQVAAKVIESYTGVNYAADLPYSDEHGAEQILQKHGGLSGLFTHLFGAPIHSNYQVGDPVLVQLGKVELIGIFMKRAVWCKTTRGLLSVSPKSVKEGWHIG
jgi:hypothetical protein